MNYSIIRAIIYTVIIWGGYSCLNPSVEQLVKRADYLPYLNQDEDSEKLTRIDEEIEFWSTRLSQQPNSQLYGHKLALLWSERFKLKGKISDLYKSDSVLNSLNIANSLKQTAMLQSLAANATTAHHFQLAKEFTEEAWQVGENRYITTLLSIDANLELGNYQEASELLGLVAEPNSFDYLIRLSRIKDIQGDLPQAITIMEKALDQVMVDNQPRLYIWTLANLGDMYGHAGRIKDAYSNYKKVLELDRDHYHALEGLAWIAYSHDLNTAYAWEIVNYLQDHNYLPDQLLTEAELLEYSGDSLNSALNMLQFVEKASQPEYGNMFNRQLSILAGEVFGNYHQALALAKKEIENRPTPLSYDLLAWCYFQAGDLEQAYSIAQTKVKDQSFEPEVMYHLGAIYQAYGKKQQARKMLREAMASSFELGPLTTQKVKALLES